MTHSRSKVASFIFDNSLLLLAGTAAAVIWANLDISSYDRAVHTLHLAQINEGRLHLNPKA